MIDESKKRMLDIINYFTNVVIVYIVNNKDKSNKEISSVFNGLIPEEYIQLVKDVKYDEFVALLYQNIPSTEDCITDNTKVTNVYLEENKNQRIIH